MEINFDYENNLIDLDSKNLSDEIELFSVLKNVASIENCEELILSNNNLTRLIPDLSFLSSLKHLDLSNNPFEDFSLILMSLKSIAKLESLKITLNKPEDSNIFLTSLSNLRILNGKLLKDDHDLKINIDIDIGEIEETNFNIEQQRYNQLFTKINEKVKAQGRDAVNSFYSDYQKILEDHNEKINFMAKTNSRVKYYNSLMTAKHVVHNYFLDKLLELNDKKDKDLTNLIKEALTGVNEVKSTQAEIMDKIHPKIEKIEKVMIKKLDNAKRVNNASTEFDKLSSRYKNLKFECETYIDELNLIKDRYTSLEKENQVLTDKVLKLTKDLVDKQDTKGGLHYNLGSPDKFKAYYNIARIASPKKNIKILTKKNMHDLIESIYESKNNFDKKCIEIRMPRETMEQHMYTFLNQKFGLKNLIIEWATSIINGIKMYAAEDSDICLFGKILRNEIEEDYRNIFRKLKSSIFDLLIYFLKFKNPLKSNLEIKELANKKVTKGIPVNEEEWKGIIYYLYETEDAKHLEGKIVEFIRRKNFEKQNFDMHTYLSNTNKKLTRAEINSPLKEDLEIEYKNFQGIILDYQIKCRIKYLRNIYNLFKELDNDENGILNENEFIQLVANTDLFNEGFSENSNRLLNLVDPANHKQVTFSEIVTCFSKENVKEMDSNGNVRKANLLDKISTKEYNFNNDNKI